MTPEEQITLITAINALLDKAELFVPATEALSNGDLAGVRMRLWAGPNMDQEIEAVREALNSYD